MSQPERGYNSQKPPGFLNKTREFLPIVRILLQTCLNPLTKAQNQLTPDRLLSNLNHRDTQGDTRTCNSLFTLFQNANVRKPAHHGSLSPCDHTISLGVLPCTPTRPGSPRAGFFNVFPLKQHQPGYKKGIAENRAMPFFVGLAEIWWISCNKSVRLPLFLVNSDAAIVAARIADRTVNTSPPLRSTIPHGVTWWQGDSSHSSTSTLHRRTSQQSQHRTFAASILALPTQPTSPLPVSPPPDTTAATTALPPHSSRIGITRPERSVLSQTFS